MRPSSIALGSRVCLVADRLEASLRANADDLLVYLERRVGPNDAPDALAEVMTIAWRRSADLPTEPVQARMWLYGVARNLVANTERSQFRRNRLAGRLRDAMDSRAAPAADEGLEVRDAIAALDDDLAEIVRLRHWEGFTLAEIALVMEEPASTVRSRYAKARALLAAALLEVPH